MFNRQSLRRQRQMPALGTGTRSVRVVIGLSLSILLLLTGCGGDSEGTVSDPGYTSEAESDPGSGDSGGTGSMTGEQAYALKRSGQTVDDSALNCSALAFLIRKYISIAEGAESMAASNDVLAMQAIQARNRASTLYGVMVNKSCDDIPAP